MSDAQSGGAGRPALLTSPASYSAHADWLMNLWRERVARGGPSFRAQCRSPCLLITVVIRFIDAPAETVLKDLAFQREILSRFPHFSVSTLFANSR